MDSIVKLSERPIDLEKGVNCPICDHPLQSTKQYQRHVGTHQEQLSLFALPNVGEDKDLDGDSNPSENEEMKGQFDAYSEESEEFDDQDQIELDPRKYMILGLFV